MTAFLERICRCYPFAVRLEGHPRPSYTMKAGDTIRPQLLSATVTPSQMFDAIIFLFLITMITCFSLYLKKYLEKTCDSLTL